MPRVPVVLSAPSSAIVGTRHLITAANARILGMGGGNADRLFGHIPLCLPMLDPGTCLRIARCPVLLIEVGVEEALRAIDEPAPGLTGEDARPSAVSFASAREALMLAWHFARCDDAVGALLLGLGAVTIRRLCELSVGEVEDLVTPCGACATLRWPNQSQFWFEVVAAARHADAERIELLWLQALRMLPREPHIRFMAGRSDGGN